MKKLIKVIQTIGVLSAVIFVILTANRPIIKGPGGDPLMALALIFSVVLFRYVQRHVARRLDVINRGTVKAYGLVYLYTVLLWCLLPTIITAIQLLDGTSSPEAKGKIIAGALVYTFYTAILGFGSGYSIIKKRIAGTYTEKFNISYTLIIVGIAALVIGLKALFSEFLDFNPANKSNARLRDDKKLVTIEQVGDKINEMKKQNMEKIDRELIDKGYYKRDYEKQNERFAEKERLASEISDSVSREMALAVVRIEKTIAFTARQAEVAQSELYEKGGLLNPVENASIDQIASSRALLNNFSNANQVYGARVSNLKSLIDQEVGAVNTNDELKKYFAGVLYERLNSAVLISIVEQNTQIVEAGEALLAFYEKTLATRMHDDDGTVVFRTDAELQTYNALCSRLERVAQNREAMYRRYIEKNNEKGKL